MSLGASWSKAGETQTFYLSEFIEKSYRASKTRSGIMSGELFIGMKKSLSSAVLGQLGVVFGATGNAKVDGVIWDDADAEFNNHKYGYKVRNTRIGIKGRALWD